MVPIDSASQMYEAVMTRLPAQDIIVKAAAVADFTPAQFADDKIKKSQSDGTLQLVRTKDILKEVGRAAAPGQVVCGFSMETRDLIENSRKKLDSKHCDLIVANSLKQPGAGFGVDTNVATLLSKDEELPLPLMSKEELADRLLDKLLTIYRQKNPAAQ